MANKKLVLFLKIAACVLPVIFCYSVFYYKGFLPLITNSISFDAKYYVLRNKKFKHIEVAAIGSSMTLNDLSSDVIKKYSILSYYNFSSWDLEITDINKITRDFIMKYNPKFIIICSSIPDFTSPGNVIIPSILSRENIALPFYYLQNFNSCLEIINRKKELDADSKDNCRYTSLRFDNYGGVPLYIAKNKLARDRFNEKITFPTDYSEQEYLSLTNLAQFLKKKRIRLIFIQTPVKHSTQYDPVVGQSIRKHFAICRKIIDAEGGTFFNANDTVFEDSLFVDNLHLNALGAKIFTERIFKKLTLN